MNTIRINNIGRKLMLAAALVSALFFAGCEKNNYAVDKDALVAPTAAQPFPILVQPQNIALAAISATHSAISSAIHSLYSCITRCNPPNHSCSVQHKRVACE